MIAARDARPTLSSIIFAAGDRRPTLFSSPERIDEFVESLAERFDVGVAKGCVEGLHAVGVGAGAAFCLSLVVYCSVVSLTRNRGRPALAGKRGCPSGCSCRPAGTRRRI